MRTAVIAIGCLLFAGPVFAHREDFLGETLVFLTLQRHAIEPELFVDAARHYRLYNTALEYGITDRTMIDGRVSWNGTNALESARIEGRHRFGDEGSLPVDVAGSLEVNVENEEGRKRYAVEPRVILSKDVERLNVTVNLSEEIPADGSRAFRIASGVRFDATQLIRVGAEVQYDFHARSGSVIPQLWLALPHEITLKGGYFAGVGGAAHFVRAAVEFEF